MIKLSSWNEIEVEAFPSKVEITLRCKNPFVNDEYKFTDLNYEDCITFATALLNAAEKIK